MELYKKVFGKYITEKSTKIGNNIMINCLWHEDKSPSLGISINENNPVYHCFGCGKRGSLIGAYMELNNVDYKTALKELEIENYQKPVYVTPIETKKEKKEVDYSEYCYNVWNNTIMNELEFSKYGKKLYELRKITYPTAVACMIGYDANKGWIFPFYRLKDGKCCGYEIRQKDFKKFEFNNSKCYKAKDSLSCLSVVYKGWNNKKAIVCEGFIDAMKMYQYLHEKKQMTEHSEFAQVDETILTPTNGVKTIPELVKENELWNKFDEVLFVLDNDDASNPITEELKQLTNEKDYNFKFFTGLKEGEDWENYYDRKSNSN